MQDKITVLSILLVVAALLMWIAVTTNSVIGGYTFCFLLGGVYAYGFSLLCKRRTSRKWAKTAFIGWTLAAGYFGELFARHLGWTVLTTSVRFMHADYYSAALNYYTIGFMPVLLLVGFLPLIEVMLTPFLNEQPVRIPSPPVVVAATSTTTGLVPPKATTPECTICHKPSEYDICAECERRYKKEIQSVRTQILRAKNVGEPATLTSAEWIQTIADHNGQCAYCKKAPYQCLEHYIPIGQGKFNGGTTAINCVPACYKCNLVKSNHHPEKATRWPNPPWVSPAGSTKY